MENIVIIGYSGHAFVVIDILLKHQNIIGYCDSTKKQSNPFNLTYLGKETELSAISILEHSNFFVCIGDNFIRANVLNNLTTLTNYNLNQNNNITTVHKSSQPSLEIVVVVIFVSKPSFVSFPAS